MENNTNKEKNEMIKKPDEKSGVQVQGHIKIFDPESGEVFVNLSLIHISEPTRPY